MPIKAGVDIVHDQPALRPHQSEYHAKHLWAPGRRCPPDAAAAKAIEGVLRYPPVAIGWQFLICCLRQVLKILEGWVAEWLKAPVLKSVHLCLSGPLP